MHGFAFVVYVGLVIDEVGDLETRRRGLWCEGLTPRINRLQVGHVQSARGLRGVRSDVALVGGAVWLPFAIGAGLRGPA